LAFNGFGHLKIIFKLTKRNRGLAHRGPGKIEKRKAKIGNEVRGMKYEIGGYPVSDFILLTSVICPQFRFSIFPCPLWANRFLTLKKKGKKRLVSTI
jgi:hypothetical protein